MNIAIAYTGHLGNFIRAYNSIKKNIVHDTEKYKFFFVIETLKYNRMRYNIENTNHFVYVSGPIYTKNDIINIIGEEHMGCFIVVDENENLMEELNNEKNEFLKRTIYDSTYDKIINFDFDKKHSSEVKGLLYQYYFLKVSSDIIKNDKEKFDYVIRYRDRLIYNCKINFPNIDKYDDEIYLAKISRSYQIEFPLICSPKIFYLFCNTFLKTIGGYRIPNDILMDDIKNNIPDHTFAAEVQFYYCTLNFKIKYMDIFFVNNTVDTRDGYGETVIIECKKDNINNNNNKEFELTFNKI
jgi:hypothetical protein